VLYSEKFKLRMIVTVRPTPSGTRCPERDAGRDGPTRRSAALAGGA